MTVEQLPCGPTAREAEWLSDQRHFLYAAMPPTIAISTLVAVILAVAQADAMPMAKIALWLALFAAMATGRLALWLGNRRAGPDARDPTTWVMLFRVGALAAGATWAIGLYLLFPRGDVAHQAFIAIAVAGLSAAAAISYAADRACPLLFAGPPHAVLLALLLLDGGPHTALIAAMVALYFVILVHGAARAGRWFRDAARYRSAAAARSAQLAASEGRLRHLLAASPAVIYACEPGGQFPVSYMSPNLSSLMGYSVEEFLAVPGFWRNNVHPEDLPRVLAIHGAVLDQGLNCQEYRFRDASGAWRWTRDDQVVVRDAAGRPLEIVGAWSDITLQKRAEAASRRQSEFQRLVAEISTSVVDARHGELDAAIEAALRRVGLFLEADRSYVLQFGDDRSTIDNTHEWCAAGVDAQKQSLQRFPVARVAWHMAEVRAGRFQTPDVDALPPEAESEKREFKRQGIRSLIILPMTREGELIGFFGLDSVKRARTWTAEEESLLKVVADVIAGALLRERAVTALTQSNRLLDSVIENVPAMLFLKRADDLRFERFNRAGEELLGYARAELIGRNDHDLFPREQADQFVAADRAVLASATPREIAEEPILTKSGELRYLKTAKIALRDDAGEPAHLLGISIDITERVRSEIALRESEARLKEAQQIARIGHWIADLRSGALEWSDVLYEIFGRDPERFPPTLTRYYAEIVHPDDVAVLYREQEFVVESGQKRSVDHRFRRADGSEGWVQVQGVAEFDNRGRAVRMRGTAQDITARKQAELALQALNAELERRVAERTAALSESERRMARAHRIARLASWEYDLGSLEWHWSEEFDQIFGLDPQATPRSLEAWLARVHPEDRDRVRAALKEGRDSHAPQQMQYRIVRPDGQLRVIKAQGEEQDGKRVGTVLDVTEQAQAERSLAEARRIARLGGWEWHVGTDEQTWSAEMYDILGVDPSTFPVRTTEAIAMLIHPDDRARVLRVWGSARTVDSFAHSFRVCRPDGTVIVCQERAERLAGDRWAGSLMDITHLVRAQERLEESQRIAHLGIWESDLLSEEERWSDELYRIYGVEPGSVRLTRAWVESRIHPDDLQRVRELWDRPDLQHRPYELTYRIIRPNGEVRTTLEIGEPAEGRGLPGVGYVGTVLDITERSRTERSLAEAQRIGHIGSWEHVPATGAGWWSDETYRLLGLERGEAKPSVECWRHLVHPDDRETTVGSYLAAAERRAPFESRYRLIRPDGELRYFVERGEWVDDRYIGTVSDITEQERIQRAMAAAQRIASTGSWEYLPESDRHWWSDEMYRLLGLDPAHAPSTDATWDAMIHSDDRPAAVATYEAARKNQANYELRYRVTRPDGAERFLLERGEWVDGRHIGTLTDITERERIQRALAEAQRIAATGSWEIVPETDERWWSDEVYRLMGLSRDQSPNTDEAWDARIHPDDRAAAIAAYQQARERRGSYEIRYRIVRPKGEIRHAVERGEWVGNRFAGTLTDITDRERALRSMAEAQRIAATGSWEYFPDRGHSWWSDEAYRLAGFEPGTTAASHALWLSLIHPDDRDRVAAVYEEAAGSGSRYELRYRILRPNGEVRHIIERGEWLDAHWAGTITDITEQERILRSLADAQEIAQTGSWEYLPETGRHWWSAQMYRLLGLEPSATVPSDEPWNDLVHPDDRPRVVAAYLKAHADRRDYEVGYRLLRRDGAMRFMVERGRWVGERHSGTLSDITEQEGVQRMLSEAQRVARLGSWEYLPHKGRLRWSDEALRLFGYEDGTVERDTREWLQRVHPDDRPGVLATLDAKRNRGMPFDLTYRIVLPNGVVRTIHERIENEINARGEAIREMGIVRDITEARQIELAMRALSGELIALEGAAYFNAAAMRLAKLLDAEQAFIVRGDPARPGELRTVALVEGGKPAPNIPWPTSGGPCTAAMEGKPVVIAQGAREHYPASAALAERGIESCAVAPIGDHGRKPIGFVGVMSTRPLPDAATAETILTMFGVAVAAAMGREQILLRDVWLRAILDNSPAGIVIKDVDLRIMAASRRDAEERGSTAAEVLGKRTRDLFPSEIAAVYEDADRKVIATGEPVEQEVAEQEDGKIRYIQNIKFPLREESGRIIGICSISTEVTERRRIEAQLAHAQKMEAIGALTGGMAHDFNNYLAVIIGNLEMLKEDLASDPRAIKLIEAALRGATRSEELTRSLLAFARHQPLAPTVVDVGERVAETTRLLERTLGEHIAVRTAVAADLWPVIVDDGQLASSIVNLANNARDAMPEGGVIEIAARNERFEDGNPAIPAGLAPGEYVVIEVGDTGIGMNPDVAANAFEPFFTTKGPGHGTGLGLSMVYGFVTQSGGQVEIDSAPGRGTVIRLYLPRAPLPGVIAGALAPVAPSRSEIILLVEDNKAVRRTVARQLDSLGYRVIEAESGDAAVPVLERRASEIDLVLSDVVMPGKLDGYALARLVRERYPEIKVVLGSGFAGERTRRRNAGPGGPTLLSKPYRREQLARALRSALDSDEPGAAPEPGAAAARTARKENRS